MILRRLSPPDTGPGTTDHVIVHDGLRRPYRVHLPPVLPLGSPLVIQLHGGGGNGTGLDRLTRFHPLADREGFAVVSPSGYNRRWNDGRRADAPSGVEVDDVGLLAALIDCVARWLPVDRSRVYVAGISNGAMMGARLANELPDRIAAVAQVAGTVAEDAPTWWRPGQPVPFLQIHGSSDPIVDYAGGAIRRRRADARDRGRTLGVDDWAALLVAANAATGPDEEVVDPDVSVRRWRGPSPQSDVEFWRVEGGGHTWPGGIQYLPVGIVGTTSPTYATEAIWRFLSSHRLSAPRLPPP